jgi:hypothetical protein
MVNLTLNEHIICSRVDIIASVCTAFVTFFFNLSFVCSKSCCFLRREGYWLICVKLDFTDYMILTC